MTKLTFKPVTASTVGDFEKVFGARGGPNWCWCMAWRATSDEIKGAKGPQRHKQMLDRIGRKVPVGLVAYEEGVPTAWVSVAPKKTFRGLGGTEEIDTTWSITCLFVPRTRRGENLSAQLIDGAVAYAKKRKAKLVEAYPVDPTSPSYRHMGFVSAYERAGFTETGREGTRRHVMVRKF